MRQGSTIAVAVADATAGYRLRALLEPLRLELVPSSDEGWQVRVTVHDDDERKRALGAVRRWAADEGRSRVEVVEDGQARTLGTR